MDRRFIGRLTNETRRLGGFFFSWPESCFMNAGMLKFIHSFYRRMTSEYIGFLAGGVGFYGMLALFPAMAGLVSLFGLVASPHAVSEQLDAVRLLFPPDVFKILQGQLDTLLSQPDATLSWTFVISLLITVYSSTKGTKAILAALNDVFAVNETRSWFFQQVQSFALTFGGLLTMVISLVVIVAVPLLLRLIPASIVGDFAVKLEPLRWGILAGAIFGGLFVLFAYGPNRKFNHRCLRPTFWGAFAGTALWIAAAVGGSIFVQMVPSANAAYGSLSAIIALMTWLYVSAYTVLIGGALTATLEEFTCAKTSNLPKTSVTG